MFEHYDIQSNELHRRKLREEADRWCLVQTAKPRNTSNPLLHIVLATIGKGLVELGNALRDRFNSSTEARRLDFNRPARQE